MIFIKLTIQDSVRIHFIDCYHIISTYSYEYDIQQISVIFKTKTNILKYF